MEISRLLNCEDPLPQSLVITAVPAKGSSRGERVGKERVEKSCPSCGRKNHIRTTNCKTCGEQLRGRARAPPKSKLRRKAPSSLLPPPAWRRLAAATPIPANEAVPVPYMPPSSLVASKTRSADRPSRQCRICSTRNHIRVTLCSNCRRNMRTSA